MWLAKVCLQKKELIKLINLKKNMGTGLQQERSPLKWLKGKAGVQNSGNTYDGDKIQPGGEVLKGWKGLYKKTFSATVLKNTVQTFIYNKIKSL